MATAALDRNRISEAEWEARQQLAACYRVFDMLGWSEMIYNHITLKVPGEEGAFLINPFGLHFSEVTASNLVKIDIDGAKLDDSPYPVNLAASPSIRCSTATCPTRIASCTRIRRRAWRSPLWRAG